MITLSNVNLSFPVYHGDKDSSLRAFIESKVTNFSRFKSVNNHLYVDVLKNINLHIENGDRVGVIGRNGSGKSTLLRTIAGIYPATSGKIEILGNIRSFFNIGSGLDFSSSGYRNIKNLSYFYTQNTREIDFKIPSIIEFSELEEYIFMPVSTYSSGMMARLMVSVALAFDSENIIFDEAIGAGDEKFLNKVNKRLSSLIESSNSFILATHSTELMKKYCTRAIWIHNGEIVLDDTVKNAIEAYHREIYS